MSKKIKVKKGTIEETLLLPLWDRAYETQPIHKDVKTGISLGHKIALTISDLLGFCSMVHITATGRSGLWSVNELSPQPRMKVI